MTTKKTRRDFLHPSSLGTFLNTITGKDLSTEQFSEERDGWLLRYQTSAMGTKFEVLVDQYFQDHVPVIRQALDQIHVIESKLSVFIETSQISQINQSAGRQAVVVDPDVFELLEICRQLSIETDGYFDVCLGSLINYWKTVNQSTTDHHSVPESVLAAATWRNLELDPKHQTVYLNHPDCSINLGSIGKGYALSKVIETLRQAQLPHFLVHGGHSSICAIGHPGWQNAWLVDFANPSRLSQPMFRVQMKDTSVSTSSISVGQKQSKIRSHVIHPKTGQPLESSLISVSIFTPDPIRAEALSTALLAMGIDKAQTWCQDLRDCDIAYMIHDSSADMPRVLFAEGFSLPMEVLV